MAAAERHRVLLLPGAMLPAELAYGALIAALGERAEAVAKDLDLYADDAPPAGWTLDSEIAGVERCADELGWERFHLVGYSGGGAAAVAAAARIPDRLLSLALLEPAWAGSWDLTPGEVELGERFKGLADLPADEFARAFMELGVAPGVELPVPPPGPPPPWMAKRPAGIVAFTRTFASYPLEREALGRFARPVYLALGALSNQDQYGAVADRLARAFPDFTLEVFEDRHHFDPPHRVEPERLATSLLGLWERAG